MASAATMTIIRNVGRPIDLTANGGVSVTGMNRKAVIDGTVTSVLKFVVAVIVRRTGCLRSATSGMLSDLFLTFSSIEMKLTVVLQRLWWGLAGTILVMC